MMQKLFDILQLIRLLNGLITIFSILIFVWVVEGILPNSIELYALIGVSFVSLSAGNVVNDIFDIETDRKNRPDRPLINGHLNIRNAWVIYSVLITVIILLMSQLSPVENLLVILNNILLFIYSSKLKRVVLIGNITVAYLAASVFILIGIHLLNFELTLLFSVFAFFIHLIRELIKDLADLSGDKLANYNSFPIRFGVQKTHHLISVLIVSFCLVQLILILSYQFSLYFLIIVIFVSILPSLVSLYQLRSAKIQSDYDQISVLYKMIMFVGLVAFIFIRL